MGRAKGPVRVSLAYRGIRELHEEIIRGIGRDVVELDLTGNEISDSLEGISRFKHLEILILDSNLMTNKTKFFNLKRLKTLSVNKNELENLPQFMNTVQRCFPNLQHLSCLGSPLCPNYLNGGKPSQYEDYRLYVISRLPHLRSLDHQEVSSEEKQKSQHRYRKKEVVADPVALGPDGTSVKARERARRKLEEISASNERERRDREERNADFERAGGDKIFVERKKRREKEEIKKIAPREAVRKAAPKPAESPRQETYPALPDPLIGWRDKEAFQPLPKALLTPPSSPESSDWSSESEETPMWLPEY